jgi:HlyD family secretion protein
MRSGTKVFLIVALLAIVVAGVAAFRYFAAPAAPSDVIEVSGNIELDQIPVAFKVSGRLIERAAGEGDSVKKGMVVARLDQDQLRQHRQEQEAQLRATEAVLAQAETTLELQRQSLKADLEVRGAELRTAEARLKDMRQGARPQEVQEAASAVDGAQAEVDRAGLDYERAQRLQKNDDIPRSQLEAARARLQSAQAVLKQAQERLALVKAGTRPDAIEGGEAQLAGAQAALKLGAVNELQVVRSEQELTVRKADIERVKAQISVTDTQLKETEALAPLDGVVLVKSAEVGEVLAPGSPVMTIGDLEHPWLRAYIGERDLGRVKIGSKAKVVTDAFPDKAYDGTVSFISSEAEFTPKQIQTKEGRVRLVYRIKISVENLNRELKANMPADASILIKE